MSLSTRATERGGGHHPSSDVVRKSIHGIAWGTAAQIVLAASGYIVAIALARTLGPVNYGSYGIIYSLLMAAELLVQMGVPLAISRMIAERPQDERELTAVGLVLSLCLYCGLFVLAWFGAPTIARTFNIADGAWLVKLAAADLPFYGTYLVFENVVNGRRDFRTKSIALLLYGTTKIAGIAVLLAIGPTIARALLVNILASVVALGFLAPKVRFSLGKLPRAETFRSVIRLAVPTIAIDIGCQCLLNLDFWSFSALDAADLHGHGYYAAARNLTRIPMMMAPILIGVLVPSLAHARSTGNYRDANRVLAGAMKFLIVTLVPGCALIAAEAPALLDLLFSRSYADGSSILSLLAVGIGIEFTLFAVLLNVLLAVGRQTLAAVIAMVMTIPCAAINFLLIPLYGGTGAAVGTVITCGAAALVAMFFVWRELGRFVDPVVIMKTLLTAAVLCLASTLMHARGSQFVLELLALGTFFVAMVVGLRLLGPQDIALLRKGAAQ